jgi:cytochrome oxidase assembly protein ShyY1
LLLRPSCLLVFSFAATCYTMLTPWQFGRDAHRKQQNAALGASSNATPLQLDTVLTRRRAGLPRAVAAGDGHRYLSA